MRRHWARVATHDVAKRMQVDVMLRATDLPFQVDVDVVSGGAAETWTWTPTGRSGGPRDISMHTV